MLKVGDRVRFLNAVGGGVVKGIKDRNIVLVEDEDGFDVPVPVSELVVVAEEQDQRMRRSRDDDRPSSGNTSVSMRQLLNQDVPDEDPTQPDESTDVPSPSLFTADLDTPQGENLNVSLVVSPHGEGHFDFYLLNDSNYALLYVVSTQADSHLMCRDAGTAEAHTRVLLSQTDAASLSDWEHLLLQILPFKPSAPFSAKPAFSIPIRLSSSRLFRPGSFSDNEFFEEKVLAIPLISDDVPAHPAPAAQDLPQTFSSSEPLPQPNSRQPADPDDNFIPLPRLSGIKIVSQPKRQQGEVLEVNLQAEALFDNPAEVDGATLLTTQIDRLRQTMEKNKRRKNLHVLFLLGSSDGDIHRELTRILKMEYSSCAIEKTDVREYGRGAVLVTIH